MHFSLHPDQSVVSQGSMMSHLTSELYTSVFLTFFVHCSQSHHNASPGRLLARNGLGSPASSRPLNSDDDFGSGGESTPPVSEQDEDSELGQGDDDDSERNEDAEEDRGRQQAAGAGGIQNLLDATTVPLMQLFSVNSILRQVDADTTSDGDSCGVLATSPVDLIHSIMVDEKCTMEMHSRSNRRNRHRDTRVQIQGEAGGFRPRHYGRKCRRIALGEFPSIDLFEVHGGVQKFHVTLHSMRRDNVGGEGYLSNKFLSCIDWALNVARCRPSLTQHYRDLGNLRGTLYGRAVKTMPRFEFVTGKSADRTNVGYQLHRVGSEQSKDFIKVFWEALKLLSDVKVAELSPAGKRKWKELLAEEYTSSPLLSGEYALTFFPDVARQLYTFSIFSARSVGTKAVWPDKKSASVKLCDPKAIDNAVLAHSKAIFAQSKLMFNNVPEPERELIHSLDIATEFAPSVDGNAFVGNAAEMSEYIKECMRMTKDRQKDIVSSMVDEGGECFTGQVGENQELYFSREVFAPGKNLLYCFGWTTFVY
jgi:hypothetical protein